MEIIGQNGDHQIDREVFAVSQVRFPENGRAINGDSTSGFFYVHNNNHLYFITNRHVVIDEADKHKPDELRLSLHTYQGDLLRGSKTFHLPLYKEGNPLWYEHPRGGKEIDIVAIPVDIDRSQYVIEPFSQDDIILPNANLTIAEDLLVIGYPLGLRDNVHNLPIIRNATLASVYPVPFDGKPIVVIDSRLHRGTSGSPVLTTTNAHRNKKNSFAYFMDDKRYLVGIHCEAPDLPYRDPNKDEPLGLNYVWFAGLIVDIITQNSNYLESLFK